MRKIISYILLAAMTLSMVACGSAEPESTTPPGESNLAETEPTETGSTDSTTISNKDDDHFIVGNLQFKLLDGMSAEKVDDDLFLITVVPEKAYVSMFAYNMSDSNLTTVETFVGIQHKSWTGNVESKIGTTDFAATVGGFDVAGESYSTFTDGDKLTGCLDFSFTDTWSVYTFMFFCYPTEEDDSFNLSYKYGELLGTAEYLGEAPRKNTDANLASTKNPLLAADLKTRNVWNGSNTKIIGESAYIKIDKSTLKNITSEEYAEFCETVVDNSGYNWVSIICDDGTGIQFTASQSIIATYGTIDSEGIIQKDIGIISKTQDGFKYEKLG